MTTRRNVLLAGLMTGLAAIAYPFARPKEPADAYKPYGLIRAVDCYNGRAPKVKRCTVDGVDVTKKCNAADDVEGWAELIEWPDVPTCTAVKVLKIDREKADVQCVYRPYVYRVIGQVRFEFA